LIEVATWWLALQAAGVAGIGPAWLLLRRLPDRGFAFTKPLGLVAWGYLLWLVASLHVLPNSRFTIALAWLILAAATASLLRARRTAALAFIRDHWRYLAFIEAVFLVALVLAAVLRSYNAEISQTEKPMDFAILNGVLRSNYFPPQDPWLAGHAVSYYYGGYVLQGMLTSITAIEPAVAYNLALAGTAALATIAAAGVGWNIARLLKPASSAGALLAALALPALVLALGSAEGVLELLAAHGKGSAAFWDWWAIEDLRPGSTREWYPDEFFFWWRASRTTPDTIVEFPLFSFLLGDLHPHLMAIPFGLTAVALALHRLAAPIPVRGRLAVAEFVATALFLGSLAWINTWDLPTFGFLVLVATALRLARDREFRAGRFALHSTALIALAVVAFLPFYISFRSQASGLLPDRSAGTRPAIAALLWLPFVVAAAGLLFTPGLRRRGLLTMAVLAPLLVLVPWSMGLFLWEGPGELRMLMADRGSAWFTALGFLLLAGFLAVVARQQARGEEPGRALPAMAGATGAMLLAGAELFYIRDVFDTRMNTVFKLSYQAWPLLAVASVGGLFALATRIRAGGGARTVGLAMLAVFAAGLAAGGTYTITATMNRTSGFTRARTLDGLEFLRRTAPGEYGLVRWLASADPGTRIVEANGRDYSPSGRVASRTGLQSVIGWVGHELQWRGTISPYDGRFEDVETIYRTEDIVEAIALLRKYEVDLVIVGTLERETYPRRGLRKFAREFEVAFESDGVVAYRVPE